MKVKYFSQLWEMDTNGTEHIVGTNQVALWNDRTHGRKPVKLQHRVLAVPVDDNDPDKCLVVGSADGVLIPSIAQMQKNPAVEKLYFAEQDKKLYPAFGWFFQGLHCSNLLAPAEQLFADKYTGFRKGEQLAVHEVAEAFRAGQKAYMSIYTFLPHIFVEPLDEKDAADTMYDIVSKKEVRVVDTNITSTFKMRTALDKLDGEYVASVILQHLVAKMWEVTSHKNASYEYCFSAAEHAKFYIGYPFDANEATDKAPILAADSPRKITRRVFLGDLESMDTALQPLYKEQKEELIRTYYDVRYGATSVKTY